MKFETKLGAIAVVSGGIVATALGAGVASVMAMMKLKESR